MIRISKAIIAVCLFPSLLSAQTPTLELPDGFEASLFLDAGSYAGRHLAVRGNGDVYLSTRARDDSDGNIIAMRDTNNDGVADQVVNFSDINGTGIEFHNGMLYASDNTTVYRFHFNGNELAPSSEPEIIVSGFTNEQQHGDKAFTFDNAGNIYVAVGAPSNACMREARTMGSPGMRPCPVLERHGGIWRFNADGLNQDQSDGVVYATGIRNTVALSWNDGHGALYFLQHGRDQLDTLFPEYYNARDNALRTGEEFLKVSSEGQVFGWPFTYYDNLRQERMLNPEYGGNGQTAATEGQYAEPIISFPAHWAPNELIFYTGDMFPESYQDGAFVAFHGSWNRAPIVQDGFNVAFIPGDDEEMASIFQIFAEGFRGDTDGFTSDARPVGLAQGTDGSLYISDSVNGRIWKITYNKNLMQ